MRIRIAATTVFTAFTLFGFAACSSDSAATKASTTAAVATTTAAANGASDFNPSDVAFAQHMVPHHQQAVEMADLALNPAAGASAAVKDLAARIKGAQDPEIKLMQGWLVAWKQPAAMPGMQEGSMGGMMSSGEMDGLKKATGAAFDKTWLTMMIAHHEGAVTSSQAEKTTGSNAEAKVLADGIIAGQQIEIAEMKKLLAA